MKELLEAGVHFGHQTKRWNPKMKKYIFGKRNGIYIIDLQKTLRQFKEASKFVTDLAAAGKNLLFVGTKRQAQDSIYEEANRCGMFYVNTRWLGGTLTNFSTIRKSIHRLKEIEGILAQDDNENLTKKERLIIIMYYYEGLTMREIGEIMELTESRVCQIHSNVMARLKAQLDRVQLQSV